MKTIINVDEHNITFKEGSSITVTPTSKEIVTGVDISTRYGELIATLGPYSKAVDKDTILELLLVESKYLYETEPKFKSIGSNGIGISLKGEDIPIPLSQIYSIDMEYGSARFNINFRGVKEYVRYYDVAPEDIELILNLIYKVKDKKWKH